MWTKPPFNSEPLTRGWKRYLEVGEQAVCGRHSLGSLDTDVLVKPTMQDTVLVMTHDELSHNNTAKRRCYKEYCILPFAVPPLPPFEMPDDMYTALQGVMVEGKFPAEMI
jgi:hypothetical protein